MGSLQGPGESPLSTTTHLALCVPCQMAVCAGAGTAHTLPAHGPYTVWRFILDDKEGNTWLSLGVVSWLPWSPSAQRAGR